MAVTSTGDLLYWMESVCGFCLVKYSQMFCFYLDNCGPPCLKSQSYFCGSDNQDYSSKCHMAKQSCKQNRQIVMKHEGKCGMKHILILLLLFQEDYRPKTTVYLIWGTASILESFCKCKNTKFFNQLHPSDHFLQIK